MFGIRTIAAALLSASALFAQVTVTSIGSGCPNTNGTPVLSVDQGGWLNKTSTFTVTNLPNALSGQLIVVIGGASVSTWGGAPLPADLTPFGAPGCTLYVDPTFIGFINYSGTVGQFSLLLPNDPFLLTCNAVVQVGVCDPALPTPLDLSLSNALSSTFGQR